MKFEFIASSTSTTDATREVKCKMKSTTVLTTQRRHQKFTTRNLTFYSIHVSSPASSKQRRCRFSRSKSSRHLHFHSHFHFLYDKFARFVLQQFRFHFVAHIQHPPPPNTTSSCQQGWCRRGKCAAASPVRQPIVDFLSYTKRNMRTFCNSSTQHKCSLQPFHIHFDPFHRIYSTRNSTYILTLRHSTNFLFFNYALAASLNFSPLTKLTSMCGRGGREYCERRMSRSETLMFFFCCTLSLCLRHLAPS